MGGVKIAFALCCIAVAVGGDIGDPLNQAVRGLRIFRTLNRQEAIGAFCSVEQPVFRIGNNNIIRAAVRFCCACNLISIGVCTDFASALVPLVAQSSAILDSSMN